MVTCRSVTKWLKSMLGDGSGVEVGVVVGELVVLGLSAMRQI